MPLSLRKKVALAFSAVTIVLLVTQALGVRFLAEAQEERLITALIRDDIASVVRGYEAAPSTLPPLDDRLNGYLSAADSSSPALPATVSQLPFGTHELIANGREIHVAIVPFNDVRLYRVYNFSVYEKHFKEVINALMATTGVFALVAIWLAFGLSGILVRQVANLANQVAKLRQDSEPSIDSGEFDEQELIGLVGAFNDYHRRMADMVAREKEFTGNISHELRTPLTAIKTSCELLDLDTAITGKSRKRLQQIDRAVDNIRGLTNALLMLAREESVHNVEPVAVASLVETALMFFADRLAEKKLQTVIDVDRNVHVVANRSAFAIVLSNLIDNAVRHTDCGRVRFSFTDGWLHIEDTGPGIPTGALPYVFDRFYQAAAQQTEKRGFGIGLSIVSKICDRYGWLIKVASEPDQGTRISLRLPSASSDAAEYRTM
ncbi:two-component sensor histidine kinase [Pandoraea cepalis]|uniref:histidine kinase n=1 Tax=Pandoraea cepalis TaxID=2508294 RepID=A0AAW7MPN0_9BURK|nr:HAMP domain-containing sensor histidine kinase [Pandoraea cepalis]MDN4574807.1 two-component sensor histidine kinase [Pandoraea cepalis]MDN4580310.1 two-component sensor histidine kinase [Pandoraea cepalis]